MISRHDAFVVIFSDVFVFFFFVVVVFSHSGACKRRRDLLVGDAFSPAKKLACLSTSHFSPTDGRGTRSRCRCFFANATTPTADDDDDDDVVVVVSALVVAGAAGFIAVRAQYVR